MQKSVSWNQNGCWLNCSSNSDIYHPILPIEDCKTTNLIKEFKAEIPIETVICPTASLLSYDDETNGLNMPIDCTSASENLEISVSFPICVIAILSFIGW